MSAKAVANKTVIIVTTYNPQIDELKKNLFSYATQVPLVLICDNSDKPACQQEVAGLTHFSPRISVISMCGNKGIAAAQNSGTRFASENGYEYVIEIDQDSKLPDGYVEAIAGSFLKLIAGGEVATGIGPIAVRSTDGFVYDGQRAGIGIIKVEKTLSSGFFYPLASVEKVGPKDEDLFIDYVDWEWCWRANSLGMSIFIDTSIEIEHFLGSGHRRFIFWKVGVPAPIRHYYQYRNSLYMLSKNYVPFSWKWKRFILNWIKIPFYLSVPRDRFLRFRYIGKGIGDYFRGKVGMIC